MIKFAIIQLGLYNKPPTLIGSASQTEGHNKFDDAFNQSYFHIRMVCNRRFIIGSKVENEEDSSNKVTSKLSQVAYQESHSAEHQVEQQSEAAKMAKAQEIARKLKEKRGD